MPPPPVPPVPKQRGSLASAIDIGAMTPQQRQEALEAVRALKNLDHDLDSKTFTRIDLMLTQYVFGSSFYASFEDQPHESTTTSSIPTTLWPRQQVKESEEKVEESERREKKLKILNVVEIGNLAWWLAIGMAVGMTWYGT